MPNYFVPLVPRQGNQVHRLPNRRTGPQPQQQQQQQQQMLPQRGGNRGNFRYAPNVRNAPDGPQGQGMPQGMPLAPMAPGTVDGPQGPEGASQPAQASTLASALALAPPEQQRAMLGEQLYPLVDMLEHDHAGKVTGMLLEMDQTEVLHLIESPDALKAKVNEAMEVLRMASGPGGAAADQLAGLTLSETS